MLAIVLAEWIKVRSSRATWWALLGAISGGILVPVLLAWDAARLWDHLAPTLRQHMSVTPLAPFGAWLADRALAVFGIHAITAEHATGLIRTSLTAVPHRPLLLAAKAAVAAAVSLLVGEATALSAFFLVRWIVGGRPIPFLTYPVSAEIPVLLSLGVGAMIFGLIGLGAGGLFRSATPAIVVVVVGCGYVLPLVALHLPAPWSARVASILLPNLAGELSGAAAVGRRDGPAAASGGRPRRDGRLPRARPGRRRRRDRPPGRRLKGVIHCARVPADRRWRGSSS